MYFIFPFAAPLFLNIKRRIFLLLFPSNKPPPSKIDRIFTRTNKSPPPPHNPFPASLRHPNFFGVLIGNRKALSDSANKGWRYMGRNIYI